MRFRQRAGRFRRRHATVTRGRTASGAAEGYTARARSKLIRKVEGDMQGCSVPPRFVRSLHDIKQKVGMSTGAQRSLACARAHISPQIAAELGSTPDLDHMLEDIARLFASYFEQQDIERAKVKLSQRMTNVRLHGSDKFRIGLKIGVMGAMVSGLRRACRGPRPLCCADGVGGSDGRPATAPNPPLARAHLPVSPALRPQTLAVSADLAARRALPAAWGCLSARCGCGASTSSSGRTTASSECWLCSC